jgi:hypothetical protein
MCCVDQQAVRCRAQLIEIDAEAGAEISLLVKINSQCTVAGPGKADCEIQGDCGFAAAAHCVGKGENMRHISISFFVLRSHAIFVIPRETFREHGKVTVGFRYLTF